MASLRERGGVAGEARREARSCFGENGSKVSGWIMKAFGCRERVVLRRCFARR
jgi:hypothetical protein